MRRSLLLSALFAAAVSPPALAAGCSVDGAEFARSPDGTDGGGGGVFADASVDADAADAADAPEVSETKPTPVLVGIAANASGSSPGETKQAELTVFAAGVRAVVVSRALAELDAAAFAMLAKDAAFYASQHKVVEFELLLIDRAADGRPVPLATNPWNAPVAEAAVDAAIDGVIAAFGDSLGYFTFGRSVDVYLGKNPSQRAPFESLAQHACVKAHTHPKAPSGLHVGVGFSYLGATKPDASFSKLLAGGNLAVVSYLPGLESGTAEPASTVAAAADALISAAKGKPIVLDATGYPSAAGAGSTPEKQALFYKTLFAALEPRRASFALVNAFELSDLGVDACAALVAAQGEPPAGAFATYACSLGLFALPPPGGTPADAPSKPAWLEVLSGAATFASP